MQSPGIGLVAADFSRPAYIDPFGIGDRADRRIVLKCCVEVRHPGAQPRRDRVPRVGRDENSSGPLGKFAVFVSGDDLHTCGAPRGPGHLRLPDYCLITMRANRQ